VVLSVATISVTAISVTAIAMRSAIYVAMVIFVSGPVSIVTPISMAAVMMAVAVGAMPMLIMVAVAAKAEKIRPSVSWISVGVVSSIAVASVTARISTMMAYMMMIPVIMSHRGRWNC
jgi:hypothetical protein